MVQDLTPPSLLSALRIVNLGVRFTLEIVSLGVFVYWGAGLHASAIARGAAAIALPLAVATFWGVFVSPKARIPTGRLGRAALGLIVFLAACAALRDRGYPGLAGALAAVSVVSSILTYALP
jgi:hypothetical protein